jgi:hypothetical protein
MQSLTQLDGDILPASVSLEGSERRAASRPPPDVTDNAILQGLNQTPFALVRELANSTCTSRGTVWRRLTGSLGWVLKHLHSVSHSLTDAQRQIRIGRSNESLRLFESARPMIGKVLWPWMSLGFICGQATKIFGWQPGSNPLKAWNTWSDSRQLRAISANSIERLKRVALNERHYYR